MLDKKHLTHEIGRKVSALFFLRGFTSKVSAGRQCYFQGPLSYEITMGQSCGAITVTHKLALNGRRHIEISTPMVKK